MLKLKQALASVNKSQADLARALGVNRSTIAHLCNNNLWPKSVDRPELKQQIRSFLEKCGAAAATVSTAFDDETAHDDAPQSSMSVEDEQMLLRKQSLTPAAKQAFGLARDPFGDVCSVEEVFLTPHIRNVREALRHTARHGGFVAIVGESGAGKSTLREDLHEWVNAQDRPIIVIEMSSVREMEDTNDKGKPVKSAQIAEAIMEAIAPGTPVRRGVEARQRQVEKMLLESHRSGNRHVLIIDEAHSLPIPTLKHLKRFHEMKDGFSKLLGIILLGQTELATRKLDEKNPNVREVVQRCELIRLLPLDNDLETYLQHRFALADKNLDDVMGIKAVEALRMKLTGNTWSLLYPLAVHNVLSAALNEAAELGMPQLTAELIAEV